MQESQRKIPEKENIDKERAAEGSCRFEREANQTENKKEMKKQRRTAARPEKERPKKGVGGCFVSVEDWGWPKKKQAQTKRKTHEASGGCVSDDRKYGSEKQGTRTDERQLGGRMGK